MRNRSDRQRPEQRSYLLRLWRASDTGPLRATLIAVGAQAAPRNFADLDTLLMFLLDEAQPTQTQTNAHDYCTPDTTQWEHPGAPQLGGDTDIATEKPRQWPHDDRS